jgi:hypothetical protein
VTRAAEPFDRLTGCETLASSERQAREREAAPWPWVYLEAWGRKYRVLAAELWDKDPAVYHIATHGTERRVPESRATLVVEALRARELDERRALEQAQTDDRAIAWLKERGRLVERDGRWELVEC